MSYGFTVHIFAFKLSFPFADLIVSSLPRGVLKFHSKIFTRYLGNWSNMWYNSSQKLPFVLSLLFSVTACTFWISHQQRLSTPYNILLLRTFTLLTADIILLHTKNPVLAQNFPHPFWNTVLPLNLACIINSLDTAFSDPDICRIHIFHAPNFMFIFHHLGCSKACVQVWVFVTDFITC